MKFAISIPYWGPWHSHTLKTVTIPSLIAAIDHAGVARNVRFIMHTISPDISRQALARFRVDYHPIAPHGVEYLRFAESHKEALTLTEPGEIACLLCADSLVSRELFSETEKQFNKGKRAIAMLGPRTLADPMDAPIGLDGKSLSEWAINNAHPWLWEHVYESGHSISPGALYFKDTSGISCHLFHLHPVMAMNDRDLGFKESTIDNDLLGCFKKDEIFVVTNNEISLCDITPATKEPSLGNLLVYKEVYEWALKYSSFRHRWNFSHKITLTGKGANSQSVVDKLLADLEEAGTEGSLT